MVKVSGLLALFFLVFCLRITLNGANADYHEKASERHVGEKTVEKIRLNGSGTIDEPFLIATADELNAVRNHLDGYFVQIANIDLDVFPLSQGEGWLPIGTIEFPFTGEYDGGGYEVLNLYINRPAQNEIGLFGKATSGIIKNLTLINPQITGRKSVGSVVGEATHGCYFENIIVKNATLHVHGRHGGGIIGGLNDSEIIRAFSSGTIVSGYGLDWNFVGGIAGGMQANTIFVGSRIEECATIMKVSSVSHNTYGGLLGGFWGKGTVINSYAMGDVTGTNDRAGGYIGYVANDFQLKTIQNSFSKGKVTAPGMEVKGFIGHAGMADYIANFWDTQTSGQPQSNNPAAIGKTTAEMKDKTTFLNAGWDFETVWEIDPLGEINDGYPFLRWQLIDEGCAYPVGYSVSQLTKHSALFHWVPSSIGAVWDIAIGDEGFSIDENDLLEGLYETMYSFDSLVSGQTYDVYLRSHCVDKRFTSQWYGPFSFTTVHEYEVSGGGLICSGIPAEGYTIYLSGTQSDYSYQLYRNGILFGPPIGGTGQPINWPNMIGGSYTVYADNQEGSDWMKGEAQIIDSETPFVNFSPTFDTICFNALPIILRGGSPEGGTYSGPGVIQNVFFPEFAGMGTHTITYTFVNEQGCHAADSAFVLIDECQLLAESDIINQIAVYPNPSNKVFTVIINKNYRDLLRIKVFNAKGNVVLTKYDLGKEQQFELDLSTHPSGFYIVQFIFNSGRINRTILLQ